MSKSTEKKNDGSHRHGRCLFGTWAYIWNVSFAQTCQTQVCLLQYTCYMETCPSDTECCWIMYHRRHACLNLYAALLPLMYNTMALPTFFTHQPEETLCKMSELIYNCPWKLKKKISMFHRKSALLLQKHQLFKIKV